MASEAHAPDPRSGVQPDGSWVPAFEGQRPPLPPGHEVTVQHGAYSPRKRDALAEEIRSAVLADPAVGYLQQPRWAAAVWAWARAEAQCQLLVEFLEQRGREAGDGVGDLSAERVRSAYLLLHRAEARALSGRRALGLDPLAAARLGRDKAAAAVDTAAVMAQLRREEAARGGPSIEGEVVADDELEAGGAS
jgi:hypothetical protein